MNDTSVSATVRSGLAQVHESLTDVHMAVPLGDILDRARRRRARRRHSVLAAAAGTGGSVALAAALLLVPGGAARTVAKPAQLTAWTVARQPNGEIRVTIRELKYPAGLQRKLRADGVPASVRFNADQNRACRPYPASQAVLARVYPYGLAADGLLAPPPGKPLAWQRSEPVRPGHHPTILFAVIRPSALPSGSGVQITSFAFPHTLWIRISNTLGLIYASPGCTGT